MNDSNFMGQASALYKQLIDAYDCYDPSNPKSNRHRYQSCYTIVDEADYFEICYVISLLRQFKDTDDYGDIGVGEVSINTIVNLLKMILDRNQTRRSFLLEILEEARERKRPILEK